MPEIKKTQKPEDTANLILSGMSKGGKRPKIGFGNREDGVHDILVKLPKNYLTRVLRRPVCLFY